MSAPKKVVDINTIIENLKQSECLRERQNRDSLEVLAQTNILQEHNDRLTKQISEQKQALLDLNKQSATKSQEVKLKKAAMKYVKDAQKSFFKNESERIDEMCKSYEEQWELTRIGIASIYKEVHKLNFNKSVKLQSNIFQVDTFEFDEIQIKEEASQESNCSALSIEDWVEQEPPGDDELASQLEQLNETNNGYSTEDTQNWQLPEIQQGTNDAGDNSCEFPKTNSFARRNSSTTSKKQDQFYTSQKPQGGVIPRQQKGVEVFKLTSSGRGFKQKAVTSAVVTSPFDVGVSETACTMGKVQSTAATNQLRQKPAQNSNTDDSSYWDYDFGDFYEDDEDDWPEASSLPRRNTDDDDSNPKRQQYVFQPRRSLMK